MLDGNVPKGRNHEGKINIPYIRLFDTLVNDNGVGDLIYD